MIEKLNTHYSFTTPASVHDEEALTALELAGRQGAKINEVVDEVNTIPTKIEKTLEKHIADGEFNDIIDKYAGDLRKDIAAHIEKVDREHQKHAQEVDSDIAVINSRVDNLLNNPGTPTEGNTELIDIRTMSNGVVAGSAGAAVREGDKLVNGIINAVIYVSQDDGRIDIIASNNSTGEITFRVNHTLAVRMWDTPVEGHKWSDIALAVEGVTVDPDDEQVATIHLPSSTNFIYNAVSKTFLTRTSHRIEFGDIVLLKNLWSSYGGGMLDPWINKGAHADLKLIAENGVWGNAGLAYPQLNKGGVKIEIDTNSTGLIKLTVGGAFNVAMAGLNKGYDDWSALTNNSTVSGLVEITEDGCVFNLTSTRRKMLVFNYVDEQIYLREPENVQPNDFLLLGMSWGQVTGGAFYEKWLEGRINELENRPVGGGGTDEPLTAEEEAKLANHAKYENPATSTFIFFTDPHVYNQGEGDVTYDKFVRPMKKVFDASMATFAVCGGDWIGNLDTKTEAWSKLVRAYRKTNALFDAPVHYAHGNHDTNYQGLETDGAEPGTGRFEIEVEEYVPDRKTGSIIWDNNLDVAGNITKPFDYDFTRCIILNTGVDWEDNAEKMQAQFAHLEYQLASITADTPIAKIIVFAHIGLNGDDTVSNTLDALTKILNAFNTRSSVRIYYNTDGVGLLYDDFDFTKVNCMATAGCVITGHNHKDASTMVNHIPVISTTHLRDGDVPSFDLCSVDPMYGKLYMTRFGTGEDRVIDLAGGGMMG